MMKGSNVKVLILKRLVTQCNWSFFNLVGSYSECQPKMSIFAKSDEFIYEWLISQAFIHVQSSVRGPSDCEFAGK